MADTAPSEAVAMAWNALTDACTEGERAALPSDAFRLLNRLDDLRNRASNHAEAVIPGAARDFVDCCLSVARLVEMARHVESLR